MSSLLQGFKLGLRHVLMVEGDDVAASRERQQVLGRAIVAEHRVRAYLRRALIGGSGQHPEPDAKSHRGGCGHPGELACSDHADNWLPPGLSCGLVVRIPMIHYPP